MNGHPHRQDRDSRRDRRGVILLITLVILVILSTLGYTLSVRVAARRHRDQYIIDYSIARHACASGMRYALASLDSLDFELISRPNEPDFSDVFALSEPEYQKLLDQMELIPGHTSRSAIRMDRRRARRQRRRRPRRSKTRLKRHQRCQRHGSERGASRRSRRRGDPRSLRPALAAGDRADRVRDRLGQGEDRDRG